MRRARVQNELYLPSRQPRGATSLPVRNTRPAPLGALSVCYSPVPTSTTSFRRWGAARISTHRYGAIPFDSRWTGMLTASGSNPRLDRLMRSSGRRLLTLQLQPPAAHLLQWGQRALLSRNLEKGSRLVLSSPLYLTPKSARNLFVDRSPSIPARVHALTAWIELGGAAVAEVPTVGQAAALRSATTAT